MLPHQKPNIYFSGLNGIRLIAACFEIFYHTEHFKLFSGLEGIHGEASVIIGDLGVNIFFVLSGFLITYVLLQEHKKTGTIHIKKFYVRRILRIWPLYYLITLLSFFVFPYFLTIGFTSVFDVNYINKLFMFLFFIPNLAIVLYNAVPFAAQMWGVGVEEQFYLFWPVGMRLMIKRMWLFLLSVIIITLIVRIVLSGMIANKEYNFPLLYFSNADDPLPQILRFDCLAIGGIGAYLLYNKSSTILKWIFKPYLQAAVYLTLIFSIVFGIKYSIFYHDVYSILSLVIIMNVATNQNSILKLESKFFNYFGQLSYGLYTFHPFCIAIALFLLKPANNLNSTIFNFALYSLVCSLTLGISIISNRYFEQWFLKQKKSYSIILTGDGVEKD